MDLSVVIVSWNVRELLLACLDSLYRSLKGSSIEHQVLIVDNASQDESAEAVSTRFPQAQLIANSDNRGFAAASNQGLERAKGQFVALLNPDTVVVDDALGQLLQFMAQRSSAGMVGPSLAYEDGSFQHSAFRFPSLAQAFFDFFPLHPRLLDSSLNGRYARSLYATGRPFRVDHPLGACMLVRSDAVAEVGALDEGFFMYCEEVDWALRMKHAGWEVYCVPQARLIHYGARSTRQFRDEMFVALWRSRFLLFAKHYGAPYNWLVRRIVRLGVWRMAVVARLQAEDGTISEQQLRGRLDALQRVRELAYG